MLLTVTATFTPATDLGFLLHKSPFRPQTFEQTFGRVHVFYPEATNERCTVAVLLDVDPVGLVRDRKGPAGDGGLLAQYVNDRPYVASSFLSVALARIFGTAMSGRSKERPELASMASPFEARLSVIASSGGEELIRKLFAPLGYAIGVEAHALDEKHPEWGEGKYFSVTLSGTKRLSELLNHLYVLVPVLDDEKHYWVSDDEVEKLLRHGEGWLAAHPERELITRRYLKHQRSLSSEALARLAEDTDDDAEEGQRPGGEGEAQLEAPLNLNEHRASSVVEAFRAANAARVLDLGCGQGNLLRALLQERSFTEIVGVDVSIKALETAKDRLGLERLPEMQRTRLKLLHSSLTYRDRRLSGYDAAALIEVIEHLDPQRLSAAERVVFEFAKPGSVVVTTPNAEYNVKFARLKPGAFRHADHRFEWTRAQFESWARGVCERFGYRVRFAPVGPGDEVVGSPTQMAVFSR